MPRRQQLPDLGLNLDELEDEPQTRPNMDLGLDLNELEDAEVTDQFQLPQAPTPRPAPAPTQSPAPMSIAQMQAQNPQPPGEEGYWAKFRNPLTDIGTRTAKSIRDQLGEPTNLIDKIGQGLIDFGGSAIDQLSAPINAIPALLTGGSSMLGKFGLGQMATVASNAARVASAPTAVSGVQRMSESPDWMGKGLGALEAIGGALGMRAPKLATLPARKTAEEVVQQADNVIASAPKPVAPPMDAVRQAELFSELSAPIDDFATINAKMNDYINRADSLTAAELADAQALNKVWRNHPEFDKPKVKVTAKTVPVDQPIDPVAAARHGGVDTAAAQGADEYGVIPPTTAPSAEAVAAARPTRASAPANAHLPDYSPASELAARKILSDSGIPVSPKMSNKQIIDAARLINQSTGGAPPTIPPVTATGGATPPLPPKPPARTAPYDMTSDAPMSTPKATDIFGDTELQIPPGMTSARTVASVDNPASYQELFPEIARGEAKMPPTQVRAHADGTFSPIDFPDVILDGKDGKIIGTFSGNPPRIPEEVASSRFVEYANLPRALQASMDLSFPLRQGLGLIHTKGWWKAWGDMVKAGWSDKGYKAVMDDIRSRPNFKPTPIIENGKYVADKYGMKMRPSLAEEAGLAVSDMITKRELEHYSQLAENIPGVGRWIKASNRAYTAFANKVRADTFDSLVKDFSKGGTDVTKDLPLAKELATFVNAASGRGNLGQLEKSAKELNTVFFSPRLVASRMKMMGQSAKGLVDPRVYDMSKPSVRREYMKSMAAIGGAWLTVAAAAKGASAIYGGDKIQISMDPTNSDFAKLKIGDTRIDNGGGFQQFLVLLAKTMRQGTTSSLDDKRGRPAEFKKFSDAKTDMDPTWGSTLMDFTRNKFSPPVGTAADLMFRNQMRPFDMADEATRMFSPIMLQDLAEILNEGNAAELATLPLEAIGLNTQTYSRENMNRRMLPGGFGESWISPQKHTNPLASQYPLTK